MDQVLGSFPGQSGVLFVDNLPQVLAGEQRGFHLVEGKPVRDRTGHCPHMLRSPKMGCFPPLWALSLWNNL